jgi:hypothetical protein
MDKNISTILADLYSIDPHFKQHEPELKKLLSSVLAAKPNQTIDSAFIHRLRTDLLEMAPSVLPAQPARRSIASPYRSIFAWSELKSSALVAIIAILVVAPVTYFATERNLQPTLKDISSSLSQRQQITLKENSAFGSIALAQTKVAPKSKVAAKTAVANPTAATPVSTMTTISSAGVPSPTQQNAKVAAIAEKAPYFYTGSKIVIPKESPVFKRTTGAEASAELIDVMKGLHFDLANLSSFTGLAVKTIHLSENKPFGYLMNVNIDTGIIDISRDPVEWASLAPSKESAAFTGKEAVTIAAQFLTDHGIDTTNYAHPIAINALAGEQGEISVVFPFTLNKMPVYNEDGSFYGITVTVDAQFKKVIEVNNIISQVFESSTYPLETNTEVILENADAVSVASKTTSTVELKTPKLVLVHTTQDNSELFIPAFYFETNASDVMPIIVSLTTTTTSTPAVK